MNTPPSTKRSPMTVGCGRRCLHAGRRIGRSFYHAVITTSVLLQLASCADDDSRNSSTADVGDATSTVVLAQILRIDVPDPPIVRVVAADDTTLFIQTTKSTYLLTPSTGTLKSLSLLPSEKPLAVHRNALGGITLVFPQHIEVFDDENASSVHIAFRLPAISGLPSAGFVGDRATIVGGNVTANSFRAYSGIGESETAHELFTLSSLDTGRIAIQLSEYGRDSIIATNMFYPFESYLVVRGADPTLLTMPTRHQEFTGDLRHAPGRYVGLPLLPGDCGFIQTIADLNSDSRFLLVYDADGGLRRVRHISAPMALVAALPKPGILAGVVTTSAQSSLVLYKPAGLCI
jgi:hypothetical protein